MSPPPPFEQLSGLPKRLTDKNYFGWERLCECRAFLFCCLRRFVQGAGRGRRPNRPPGGFSGLRPLRRLRRRACGPPIPATPPAFKNAKTPERPTGPSGAVFTCRLSPPRFFPSPPSGQPLWPPRPSRQCAYRRIPSPGHKSPQRPGSPAPCR